MSEFLFDDLSCLNRKFNCDEIDEGIIKTRCYGKDINLKFNKKEFLNKLKSLKEYKFKEFTFFNDKHTYMNIQFE